MSNPLEKLREARDDIATSGNSDENRAADYWGLIDAFIAEHEVVEVDTWEDFGDRVYDTKRMDTAVDGEVITRTYIIVPRQKQESVAEIVRAFLAFVRQHSVADIYESKELCADYHDFFSRLAAALKREGGTDE